MTAHNEPEPQVFFPSHATAQEVETAKRLIAERLQAEPWREDDYILVDVLRRGVELVFLNRRQTRRQAFLEGVTPDEIVLRHLVPDDGRLNDAGPPSGLTIRFSFGTDEYVEDEFWEDAA